MSKKHVHQQKFSLQEHAREQKRLHQLFLEEQRRQGKSIPEFLDGKSSDEEFEEDESDLEEIDEYYFLQPLTVKQRRTTLRASGVKKIDNKEKDHCKDIRLSREHCGCDCKVFCDPESCACSLAGIQCQVDRLSFPCGCSKDGCGNLRGRIEFNPIRVRTHYVHTVMRLKLEKQDDDTSPVPNQCRFNSQENETSIENGNIENTSNSSPSGQREVDLSEFNSNELGSCRDCQNPDVCNIMMQEVQYAAAAMEAEQQRTALNNLYNATQQYKNMVDNANNSAAPTSLPRVLLFNDNEEDLYHAENTTSFYNFKQEESSYSENSECSSEGSTGYDGAEYPKTYQTLTSFEASNMGNDNASPGYCAQSQQNGCVYPQNDQKFMTMNSTHQMYKMNSLPEVMTPVQNGTTFAGLESSQWIEKSTGYESPSHMACHTQSATHTTTACSYTTMTNTTCDKIAEACPSISSHINNNSQDNCDDLQMNHYSGIDSFNCSTNIVSEEAFLNLSESTVTVSSSPSPEGHLNTLHNNHITPEDKSPIDHNAENHSFTPVSKATIHNNHTAVEVPRAKDSTCQQSGQNFGEIIKESIFETVSA